jgi:hypothetical protein
MLCVYSEVDTEFLNVIYMNVIFRKVIKAINAASVPILRLMDFPSPFIFTGFNFVIDLHLWYVWYYFPRKSCFEPRLETRYSEICHRVAMTPLLDSGITRRSSLSWFINVAGVTNRCLGPKSCPETSVIKYQYTPPNRRAKTSVAPRRKSEITHCSNSLNFGHCGFLRILPNHNYVCHSIHVACNVVKELVRWQQILENQHH